jgi:hypothetical protein
MSKFMEEDDETFSCRTLRAVMFSGDALSTEMDRIRSIVKAVLPLGHYHKIKDSIDPAYVGAIGAAYQAKALVLDPLVNPTTQSKSKQALTAAGTPTLTPQPHTEL